MTDPEGRVARCYRLAWKDLRQALSNTPKADQWRKIETAPRDGTTVLVFGQPNNLVIDGNTLVEYRAPARITAAWDAIDEAWCVSGGSWLGPFVTPTHWMPLPKEPNT